MTEEEYYTKDYYRRRVQELLDGDIIDLTDLKHVIGDENLRDIRAMLPEAFVQANLYLLKE